MVTLGCLDLAITDLAIMAGDHNLAIICGPNELSGGLRDWDLAIILMDSLDETAYEHR